MSSIYKRIKFLNRTVQYFTYGNDFTWDNNDGNSDDKKKDSSVIEKMKNQPKGSQEKEYFYRKVSILSSIYKRVLIINLFDLE